MNLKILAWTTGRTGPYQDEIGKTDKNVEYCRAPGNQNISFTHSNLRYFLDVPVGISIEKQKMMFSLRIWEGGLSGNVTLHRHVDRYGIQSCKSGYYTHKNKKR